MVKEHRIQLELLFLNTKSKANRTQTITVVQTKYHLYHQIDY